MSARYDDPQAEKIREGVDYQIGRRYSGRKANAKKHFIEHGGYENLERARANIPAGMDEARWLATIDHFCNEKYKKRSSSNKICRSKQTTKNRGGSASLSNACYKHVSRYSKYIFII